VSHPPEPLPPVDGSVDLAVNLHGQGPQSTQALRRVRPARLWSYGVPGAPEWDPEEHEVRRWCRLVGHHGCPADDADLFLRPRTGAGEGVVIHPGAATAERRWPAGRFAAVAAALAAEGHRVTVTAGPGEEALAHRVAGSAFPIADGLDLAALAALVGSSALVVCGDTGLAHLATAMGTPSVVLFGPQPPSRWGPPTLPRHRALWHPGPAAAEAGQPHPALMQVSVPEVLAAAAAAVHAGPDR